MHNCLYLNLFISATIQEERSYPFRIVQCLTFFKIFCTSNIRLLILCHSMAYTTLKNQSCGLDIYPTVTDALRYNEPIVFLHDVCNFVSLD